MHFLTRYSVLGCRCCIDMYLVPWVLHLFVSNAPSVFGFQSSILFTVVLSALHHQPSLLVRACDRNRYNFLVPVVGFFMCA